MERNSKQIRETRGLTSGPPTAVDMMHDDGGESQHNTSGPPLTSPTATAAAATTSIMPSHKPPFSHQPDNEAMVMNYTTTALSTTLPLRSVRVNASDVSPSADVPVVPEFTSIAGDYLYH